MGEILRALAALRERAVYRPVNSKTGAQTGCDREVATSLWVISDRWMGGNFVNYYGHAQRIHMDRQVYQRIRNSEASVRISTPRVTNA